MNPTITVQPDGQQFSVNPHETILNAALRAGLNPAYGCRDGHCGTCKALLLSGDIHYKTDISALSDQEREQNIILICQAIPHNDVTIKAHLLGSGEIKVKKLPSRVTRIKRLTHDVIELALKLPVSERLQFLAGQYIDILLSDGRRRSFSIANAPHDDELIILHIRHIEGGEFTGYVFNELQEKTILRMEGPHGAFYLRKDAARPLIFMAGGTGIAPVKSIIEHILAEGITRRIHMYWGVRAKRDLYLHSLAMQWQQENEHITYIPVLSQSRLNDEWQGRTGLVHEAVSDDFAELNGFDVYASGPPAMVEAGKSAFVARGLPEQHYYADAFEYQQPKKE